MAEDKKQNWTTYMAISTVIIVVCATLSTFKGGGFSTRSLMNQTLASDQWAFYQSKSLKSYIFEMQKDNLELQNQTNGKLNVSPEVMAKYQAKIDNYSKKLEQYEAEKKEITLQAKKYE